MSNRTRRLVLETAERLDYRPNSAARALTTGKTANVGIVVPDTANPFFPSLIKGIQARARESGRLVFLADTDEDPRTEAHLVEQLAGRVDGMILCSPRMGTRELLDFATKVPIVMVNRQLEGVASVLFDDASGISRSISHLSSLGHRRIAWLGGPEKSFSHAQRGRAIYDCAGRAGVDLVDLVDLGNFSPQFGSGIAGADVVLASGASAVVAYNDLLALGSAQPPLFPRDRGPRRAERGRQRRHRLRLDGQPCPHHCLPARSERRASGTRPALGPARGSGKAEGTPHHGLYSPART